jgi:hypothetical protein
MTALMPLERTRDKTLSSEMESWLTELAELMNRY